MDDWQTHSLGDLCTLVGGGTPAKNNPDYYRGEIPWASIRDMRSEQLVNTEFKITEQAVCDSSTNVISHGNVVMACRVGLGKVCILEQDTAINQDLRAVIPRDVRQLFPRFIFRWLQSISERIEAAGKGATVKGVTVPFISSLQIPLPPLKEQRRIVGLLDEAFAGIATAKANAEKNLRNARALFDGSSKFEFEKQAINSDQRKLGDVCYVDRGSSPRPIKEYFTTAADGVNWIKIGDSVEGEKYITSTKQKITPRGALESVRVKAGDFLLTNSMSFGRPYILKTDGCIHDGWYCLRLNDGIDLDYLYYLLSSAYVRDQFNRLASGSVVLNISSDLVKRALLPIPSLAEQRDAVKKLDMLKEKSDRLAALYQQKLAALDALRRSLLDQAFSGRLGQNAMLEAAHVG